MLQKLLHLVYVLFGKSHSKLKKLERGNTARFYGRVNSWASSSRIELKKDLDACVKHGVHGYHIEFLGWLGNPSKYGTKRWRDTVSDRYSWLVKECRRRNMWLFVSLVNDNAGKNSKETWNPRLEKQDSNCRFAVETVLDNGCKNVIVQTVAEVQTQYGANFEKTYGPIFKSQGFKVVYNGSGRPNGNPPAYADWNASHLSDTTIMVTPSYWNVSDHSLIIQQLCHGLDGKGNVETTKRWVKMCMDRGNVAVVFYHYLYTKHDGDVIRTIGSIK